jgi:hypothetical protein
MHEVSDNNLTWFRTKIGSKKQWELSRTTNLKSNGSYRHQGWPDSLAPGGPGEVISGGIWDMGHVVFFSIDVMSSATCFAG